MNWYRARWINNAVLDTLFKRFFTLVIALVVAVLGIYLISAFMGDAGAMDTSYGVRKRALRFGIIFAVWIAVEVIRLLVHTIRAAVTGKFLDEHAQRGAEKAQRRAERAHERQERSASGQMTAAGSTYIYRGQDPIATNVPLYTRATNAGLFITQAGRLPEPTAAAGTDEYFHAQTVSEVAREIRNPSASKDVQRSAKFLDSCDKTNSWRTRG